MDAPAATRSPSFRARVVLAIQLLLLAVFMVMAGLAYYFGAKTADTHARTAVEQGLRRAMTELSGIVDVARDQNALLQQALAERMSAPGAARIELSPLLGRLAPAFMARPTLTYVGLGFEADGEYAMLERTGERARFRHFAVLPDGQREIRNQWIDEFGKFGPATIHPWNLYDPRTRPFYLHAKEVGRAVWTESYFFPSNDQRPATLGVSLAEPVRDAAGRFVGVTDTDFDTGSLSAFLAQLENELPGRLFVLERRRDGSRRAVAHSHYAGRPDLREEELVSEAAIPAVAELLAREETAGAKAGAVRIASVRAADGEMLAGYMAMPGENRPPWTVVAVMPRAELVAPFAHLQWFAIGALAIVAVVGVFFARWLADWLSRPVAALAREIGEIQPGSGRRDLTEAGPAEVVQFARAFNALGARARTRREQLQAAGEAARRQAERLQRVNDALRRVAHLVADLTRQERECVIECMVACNEALGLTRSALWRRVPGAATMRLVAMPVRENGAIIEGLTLDAARYPEYWDYFVRERRMIVADAASDPRTARLYAENQLGPRRRLALLDVPVVVHGEIVGACSFHLIDADRSWTAEDEILAIGVADLVALTLERSARLAAERLEIERAGRLARQNAALSRAAREPALREGDIAGAFRALTEICTEGLGVARASIWLIPPRTGLLRLVDLHDSTRSAHSGGDEINLAAVPAYHGALKSGRCIAAADAHTDPRTAEFHAGYLAPHGIASMLDAGIFSRGELVGAVCFEHVGSPRTWFPEEEIFAGAVADLAALALEASARRTAEEEIVRSQQRLRLHIAGVPLAAIDRDADQRIIGWNPAAERMFGHRAEEVIGRSDYFLGLPEDRPRIERIWREALQGRAVPMERFRNVRRDGSPIVCDWHTTALHDASGALLGVSWLVEDVTERVRAEEAVRESRERLRLHIEGVPLAVIDWDRQSRIVGWNPAAERMFGFARAEMIGRDGYVITPERDRPRQSRIWHDLLRGRASLVARTGNLRRDGAEITCDWHNTLLRDDAGRVIGLTSVVEDVTERVRAENEIRALNAGLEARVAERTAALETANEKLKELDRLKSEFLATMSHELRTPLNSIIGFTGIIKQGMAGPVNAEQAKQLELVHGSARHLLSLINDVLDLSRVEAGRLQLEVREFAPAEVLQGCVDSLTPMVRLKSLVCRVDDQAPGLRVRSDRKRFLQIVTNLAHNAVKFTERGGVTLTLRAGGGGFELRVTDTGPGIKPEQMDGLFQAFRQLDSSARRVYEGTGLGLYLCRKLCRLLGGQIGVESEPGRGSTFWVRLPLETPAATAANDRGGDSSPPFPRA